MKRVLLGLLLFVFSHAALAQDSKQTVEFLRKVADEIIKENVRGFENPATGEIYKNLKGISNTKSINIVSEYSDWDYTSGVMNMAMLQLGVLLKDDRYVNFSRENYKFIFKNAPYIKNRPEDRTKWSYPFGQFYSLDELDDCGAMGAGLINVYQYDKEQVYLDYIEKAANHIEKKQTRLDDGTLCRVLPQKMTVWADDLYMSVPFLSRMGELSGDNKYFDDAVKQVIQFNDYLWDENTGLYYHCWQSDDSTSGVAHWGRANGWVIVAQVELLKKLPKDHPQRKKLLKLLNRQINGVARYQSESGLWYQLLDKQDSYLESSCSAMFVYGIAAAVNEGWIPERYIAVAKMGWNGLISKITDDGKIKDICIGTGARNALNYYYTRPVKLQDSHGTGAFILAGVEMEKYLSKNGEINFE